MKTLQEIETKVNEVSEFSAKAERKYIYVCKNNGQFHKGDCNNIPGYASFVGKMDVETANFWASEYLW